MKILKDGITHFDVEHSGGVYRWRQFDGDVSTVKGEDLPTEGVREVQKYCKAVYAKRYQADQRVTIPEVGGQ